MEKEKFENKMNELIDEFVRMARVKAHIYAENGANGSIDIETATGRDVVNLFTALTINFTNKYNPDIKEIKNIVMFT